MSVYSSVTSLEPVVIKRTSTATPRSRASTSPKRSTGTRSVNCALCLSPEPVYVESATTPPAATAICRTASKASATERTSSSAEPLRIT